MVLALWCESRLSCNRLRAVRTCPVDVSTCCSSFIINLQLLIKVPSSIILGQWGGYPCIFIYFSHGVRLSALGTAATVWRIVPAADDIWWWWWFWCNRWNANWQGKPKYSEKTCPTATLSITNTTWPYLGSNPGRRGGKTATNRLSYARPTPCRFHSHLFTSKAIPRKR
jgi:hypothetical protein